MKLINKYILKSLVTPFILSLSVIVFILLTQFIIKNLDRFLGKDIPISVILKFLLYNSAWIFSLAMPMAVLVATIMTFGRLSSDNEITALKASGISYLRLLFPGIIFGLMIISFMIPFNLWLLPEMNHNIKKLSYEISRSKPDLEIKVNYDKNYFLNRVIHIGEKKNNEYLDITINDKNQHSITKSKSGTINSLSNGMIFNLKNGTIHQKIMDGSNKYRTIKFDNYQVAIPFNEKESKRNIARRDREMNFEMLINKIKEIDLSIINNITKNNEYVNKINAKEERIEKLENELKNFNNDKDKTRSNRIQIAMLKNDKTIFNEHIKRNNFNNKNLEIDKNKYTVEIHKKFSLPFACFIFILLGTPLGIISRKGNMGISVAISLVFFILYWSFITIGEYLADSGKLNAGISIWLGNIVLGVLALYLFYYSSKENSIHKFFNLDFLKRILRFKKRRN
tara:strand:- start:3007 stop:4365 length:1359 start_codon:yes stop_codon:yes gene_type:complete